MPYKSEKISLNKQYGLDKRVRLTPEDHQTIKKMWDHGNGLSITAIARYGIMSNGQLKQISKRTVQLVLFPERRKKILERAKEVKRWVKYNRKEIHTPVMRKHRQHKQKLYLEGKITS